MLGELTFDAADAEGSCEAEEFVTVVGFGGALYCAIEPADFSCRNLSPRAEEATLPLATGGTMEVCITGGFFCADGFCG